MLAVKVYNSVFYHCKPESVWLQTHILFQPSDSGNRENKAKNTSYS